MSTQALSAMPIGYLCSTTLTKKTKLLPAHPNLDDTELDFENYECYGAKTE